VTVAGMGTVTAIEGGSSRANTNPDDARVRVAHASPDAPDVDVYVEGDRVIQGLSFRSVTDYLELSAGTYTVAITAAEDPDTVVFEGDLTLEEATDYTIAAIGELGEDTFRPEVLVDDNEELSDQIAQVRVLHASPDAPAVDVTAFDGQFAVFHGVEFGETTRYLALPAREDTFGIRPTDSTENVFQVDLELQGGTVYTLIAEGYLTPDDEPTDEGFGIVPATSAPRGPETARVRVGHLSPDAPAVDVYLGGDRVIEGLSFRSVTDYLEVPGGSYEAAITAAGDPDAEVFRGDLSLAAGTDYTVAAIGELGEETFRAAVLQDAGSVPEGRARVRLFHASPDAPDVDVTVNDAGTTLVDGLSFGESTNYLTFRPGRYELEVRPDSEGNDNPFDAEIEARLEPGTVYTAFVAGYFTVDDEPTDELFGPVIAAGEPRH